MTRIKETRDKAKQRKKKNVKSSEKSQKKTQTKRIGLQDYEKNNTKKKNEILEFVNLQYYLSNRQYEQLH